MLTEADLSRGLFLISGPCVIESRECLREVAGELRRLRDLLGITVIFKASYDKANRTSPTGFRGPGREEGMRMLLAVGEEFGLPLLSDVHDPEEAAWAGERLDIIQIPAFLCRQTDLVLAAAATPAWVNIKKGQFLAPWDMAQVVAKARTRRGDRLMLTERGTSFGYNTLVSDFRALPILRENGCPVVFDATHSVQQPGGRGASSGGERRFVPLLSRAAVAAGADGLFWEVHPDPERARSDGPNMLPLFRVEEELRACLAVRAALIGFRPPAAG